LLFVFEKMDRFDQGLQKRHDGFLVRADEVRAGADRRVVDHRQGREFEGAEAALFRLEVERDIDVGGVHLAPAHAIDAGGADRQARIRALAFARGKNELDFGDVHSGALQGMA